MAEEPTVRTARLDPGVMGLWEQSTRTLWLDSDLTAVERRCTLVHELVHAERGDVPCGDPALDARQERRVEHEAARRLVPARALLDGARWTGDPDELAELLEVDPATLQARLECLTPGERDALARVRPVEAA